MELQSNITAELDKAENARARGNEGQARVCARRAAGLAARAFLARRGDPVHTPSAYDVLRLIAEDTRIPAALRESAQRLTLRVDEDFKLPDHVDLIIEAREFCDGLARFP
jgi:HEPN domain-containing protein